MSNRCALRSQMKHAVPLTDIGAANVVKLDEQPIPASVEPIIRRLIETRRAWKLSISDIAERCGADWNTFVRYERGDKFPSAKTLVRWASVLGFELSLWPKGQAR